MQSGLIEYDARRFFSIYRAIDGAVSNRYPIEAETGIIHPMKEDKCIEWVLSMPTILFIWSWFCILLFFKSKSITNNIQIILTEFKIGLYKQDYVDEWLITQTINYNFLEHIFFISCAKKKRLLSFCCWIFHHICVASVEFMILGNFSLQSCLLDLCIEIYSKIFLVLFEIKIR